MLGVDDSWLFKVHCWNGSSDGCEFKLCIVLYFVLSCFILFHTIVGVIHSPLKCQFTLSNVNIDFDNVWNLVEGHLVENIA